MLVAIYVLIVISNTASGLNCCKKVEYFKSCRSACEKLYQDTSADIETTHQRHFDLRNFCPHHLVQFWKCINQTGVDSAGGLATGGDGAAEAGPGWKSCCGSALTYRCRGACRSAFGVSDLHQYCRRSDEIEFFSCVHKQQVGDECCTGARSPDCHEVCRSWVAYPARVSWSLLTSLCDLSLQRCLHNVTRPGSLLLPQRYLHCCDHASSLHCKESCKRNLSKKRIYEFEIMSILKEDCGPLVLHEGETKLAECLLQSDEEPHPLRKTEAGIGSQPALLHCCSKALDISCSRACSRLFYNNSAGQGEYERACPYSTEENLLQCNDEVVEPCELGCDGLTFCTEFNNRPTDLFRSCNRRSDEAARSDLLSLSKGYLTLPNKEKLEIGDIVKCGTDKFKALACINQIKPCHHLSQTTRICFEDCMEVMKECVDLNHSKGAEMATKLCRLLGPSVEGSSCLHLSGFARSASGDGNEVTDLQLNNPCRHSTCSGNEICVLNRSCGSEQGCRPYSCIKGCEFGRLGSFLIAEKTYGRGLKSGKGICHSICECRQGVLRHCRETCKPKGSRCKGFEHGSTYYRGCNLCSCNHGEVVCSKKLCNVTSENITAAFTTLPCKCPPHYLPVCGWNGLTYPNQCLARCAGLGLNFTMGACSSIDPCKNVRCQRRDDVCLPRRQVCLSELHKNCSQHICVRDPPKADCPNHADDPVCDTEGVTHPNPCRLFKARKELSYFGSCLAHCSTEGEVCGVDGNTYPSECAAHARYIQVDYTGNCTRLGNVQLEPQKQCPDVECPSLEPSCSAFTPPGACCPVCAGAFTALFSQKEVDRVLLAFNGLHGIDQLTVESLMSTLEREVKVADCRLRGQLTIEQDILVLLVPARGRAALPRVREACIREAEKLAVLIQRLSPRVTIPLSTSILTAARIVHQPLSPQDDSDSAISFFPHHAPLLIFVACLCVVSAYLRV